MAAGFPVKANYATGDILTATNMNDLAGTLNYLDPTAKGDLFPATSGTALGRLAVGSDGYTLVADSAATTGLNWAGNMAAGKNVIINGGMELDQRNSGSSLTPTADNTYTLDRWLARLSASSKFSVQRQTSIVPANAAYAMKVTSLAATSLAAGDYYGIIQKIEGFNSYCFGWGTSSANNATLSFQVYSSLTGTFGGAVYDSTAGRSYPFSYSIASANTWTTINVTIPLTTSGTFNTDNTTGLHLFLSLGVGSTYKGTANTWANALYFAPTGSVDVVGTNAATFYCTKVQLELGSSATTFTRAGGTIQGELAACQRYYEKSYPLTSAPATTGVAGMFAQNGSSDGGGNQCVPIRFKVEKRNSSYSVAFYAQGSGNATKWSYARSGVGSTEATATADSASTSGFRAYVPTGANWTTCYVEGQWVVDNEL